MAKGSASGPPSPGKATGPLRHGSGGGKPSQAGLPLPERKDDWTLARMLGCAFLVGLAALASLLAFLILG